MRRRRRALLAAAAGMAVALVAAALALVPRGPADLHLDRGQHVVLPANFSWYAWQSNAHLTSVHWRFSKTGGAILSATGFSCYDVPADLRDRPKPIANSLKAMALTPDWLQCAVPPFFQPLPPDRCRVPPNGYSFAAGSATLRRPGGFAHRMLLDCVPSPRRDRVLTLEREETGGSPLQRWLDRILAPVRGPRQPPTELWVQRTDGSQARRLGTLRPPYDLPRKTLAWSPDGTHVSYVVARPDDPAFRPALYILPAP